MYVRVARTNLAHFVCKHHEDGTGSTASSLVDCAHSKYYQGLAKKQYDVKLGTLGSLGDPYSGELASQS